MAITVERLRAIVEVDTRSFDKGVGQVQGSFKSLSSDAATFGSRLAAIATPFSSLASAASRAVSSMRSDLSSLSSSAREAGDGLSSLGQTAGGLGGRFNQLRGGLDGVARGAASLGTKLSIGVTAPLTLMGKQAVETFTSFEVNLNSVAAITNKTSAQMEQFRQRMVALGNDVKLPGVSAASATAQFLELVKAGASVTDAERNLANVLQFASINTLSARDAARDLVSVLNLFPELAGDTSKALNVMTNLFQRLGFSNEEFQQSLQSLGGTIKTTKLPIADFAATLGLLRQQSNLTGQEAGTALREALKPIGQLSKESQKHLKELEAATGKTLNFFKGGEFVGAREAIRQLGESFGGLEAEARKAFAVKIFGETGAKAIEALTDVGVAGFDAMAAKVKEAGTQQKLAEARAKSLGAAIEQVQAAIETAFIDGIGPVRDSLKSLLDGVSSLISRFAALAPETRKFIVELLAVSAVAGPVLVAFAGVANTLRSVIGVFALFSAAARASAAATVAAAAAKGSAELGAAAAATTASAQVVAAQAAESAAYRGSAFAAAQAAGAIRVSQAAVATAATGAASATAAGSAAAGAGLLSLLNPVTLVVAAIAGLAIAWAADWGEMRATVNATVAQITFTLSEWVGGVKDIVVGGFKTAFTGARSAIEQFDKGVQRFREARLTAEKAAIREIEVVHQERLKRQLAAQKQQNAEQFKLAAEQVKVDKQLKQAQLSAEKAHQAALKSQREAANRAKINPRPSTEGSGEAKKTPAQRAEAAAREELFRVNQRLKASTGQLSEAEAEVTSRFRLATEATKRRLIAGLELLKTRERERDERRSAAQEEATNVRLLELLRQGESAAVAELGKQYAHLNVQRLRDLAASNKQVTDTKRAIEVNERFAESLRAGNAVLDAVRTGDAREAAIQRLMAANKGLTRANAEAQVSQERSTKQAEDYTASIREQAIALLKANAETAEVSAGVDLFAESSLNSNERIIEVINSLRRQGGQLGVVKTFWAGLTAVQRDNAQESARSAAVANFSEVRKQVRDTAAAVDAARDSTVESRKATELFSARMKELIRTGLTEQQAFNALEESAKRLTRDALRTDALRTFNEAMQASSGDAIDFQLNLARAAATTDEARVFLDKFAPAIRVAMLGGQTFAQALGEIEAKGGPAAKAQAAFNAAIADQSALTQANEQFAKLRLELVGLTTTNESLRAAMSLFPELFARMAQQGISVEETFNRLLQSQLDAARRQVDFNNALSDARALDQARQKIRDLRVEVAQSVEPNRQLVAAMELFPDLFARALSQGQSVQQAFNGMTEAAKQTTAQFVQFAQSQQLIEASQEVIRQTEDIFGEGLSRIDEGFGGFFSGVVDGFDKMVRDIGQKFLSAQLNKLFTDQFPGVADFLGSVKVRADQTSEAVARTATSGVQSAVAAVGPQLSAFDSMVQRAAGIAGVTPQAVGDGQGVATTSAGAQQAAMSVQQGFLTGAQQASPIIAQAIMTGFQQAVTPAVGQLSTGLSVGGAQAGLQLNTNLQAGGGAVANQLSLAQSTGGQQAANAIQTAMVNGGQQAAASIGAASGGGGGGATGAASAAASGGGGSSTMGWVSLGLTLATAVFGEIGARKARKAEEEERRARQKLRDSEVARNNAEAAANMLFLPPTAFGAATSRDVQAVPGQQFMSGPGALTAPASGGIAPAMGAGSTTIIQNIQTPDANSFRQSSAQVKADALRLAQASQRRNG